MSQIEKLTVWQVALTSKEVYYMGGNKACDTVTSTILRIDTDDGLSGWGEVCPIPHYLPAYAGGVIPAIRELAPLLIGADPIGPEALMDKLDRHLLGHRYAKSAIDIALWDITARKAGLPVYKLLGGKLTEELPLYYSITCREPDAMVRLAREAQERGITQFQVKLGADNNWQMDVERLVRVREAVGDGPIVYGDWNCTSSQLDAIRVARAVAHLDIMIEQPCQTIDQCKVVHDSTMLPMKLDENAHDTESLLKGAALGCMDAAAIKLSKFGGLSACRRARDLCLHLGTVMCIEDTWGTDIVTAACMHLATSTPREAIMNVCQLSDYVTPRLDHDCYHQEGWFARITDKPGLGVEPDMDVLGKSVAEFS